MTFKGYAAFSEFPFFWDELESGYSQQLWQFYILLLSGVEVEEELHLLAGALPELSLVENDVAFEEFLGIDFMIVERDLF